MFSCNTDIHSESPSHKRSVILRDAAFWKHVLIFSKRPLEEKKKTAYPQLAQPIHCMCFSVSKDSKTNFFPFLTQSTNLCSVVLPAGQPGGKMFFQISRSVQKSLYEILFPQANGRIRKEVLMNCDVQNLHLG